MRSGLALLVTLTPLLSGCGPHTPVIAGAAVVVSGASIPVFHRTPIDMLVSVASGRDCSVVHLDRREAYCLAREPPPETPLFCTRSLGVPDCWTEPAKVPNHPRELADGPRKLTPAQERDRTSWWPGLW